MATIEEQIKQQSEERKKQRELKAKTCPDCGSINSHVILSFPNGEPRFGGHNTFSRLRQCKECKTVWWN